MLQLKGDVVIQKPEFYSTVDLSFDFCFYCICMVS